MKKFLLVLLVLLLILGGGVFYVYQNLESIVKTAVNKYGANGTAGNRFPLFFLHKNRSTIRHPCF